MRRADSDGNCGAARNCSANGRATGTLHLYAQRALVLRHPRIVRTKMAAALPRCDALISLMGGCHDGYPRTRTTTARAQHSMRMTRQSVQSSRAVLIFSTGTRTNYLYRVIYRCSTCRSPITNQYSLQNSRAASARRVPSSGVRDAR